MALLLYPALGKTKTKNPDRKTSIIYRVLNDEGMDTYKSVFDNNNKEDRRIFLSDPFIRKIWPFMMRNISMNKILPEYKIKGKDPSK
jgi:hypothetical protein